MLSALAYTLTFISLSKNVLVLDILVVFQSNVLLHLSIVWAQPILSNAVLIIVGGWILQFYTKCKLLPNETLQLVGRCNILSYLDLMNDVQDVIKLFLKIFVRQIKYFIINKSKIFKYYFQILLTNKLIILICYSILKIL